MAPVPAEEEEEPPEPDAKQQQQQAPAPAPCSFLWPPAVARRYKRLQKLGDGMFGDVHKACDRERKRLVAVKRLSGRTDAGYVGTGLSELAREAMSLGACRGHRSVVKLVATHADAARRDGDCFVVARYAGPVNLRQYARLRSAQGRPLLEPEVRSAMRQLLAGAKHVHRAGVVHRDMVPENVIVDRKRGGKKVYRIGGFGVSEPAAARGGDRDGSAQLASPSPYRAPELFLGSMDYDDVKLIPCTIMHCIV